MAEIRCPMCGKDNPDDLDVCQYCDARLKPLIADSPQDQGPAGPSEPFDTPAGDADDIPEWLRSLHREEDIPPEPDAQETPLPEWLIPARETRRLSTGEINMDDLGNEGWLDSFRTGGDEEDDFEYDETPEEDDSQAFDDDVPEDNLPEWLAGGDSSTRTLSGLEGEADFETPQAGDSDADFQQPEDEPGWLSKVRSRARQDAPPEEEAEDVTSEGEEFLRSLRSQDRGMTLGLNYESGELDPGAVSPQPESPQIPEAEQTPSGELPGETPGWLSKFGMDDAGEPEAEEPEPLEPEEPFPPQSQDLPATPLEESFEVDEGAEEGLDWLAQLDRQAEREDEQPAPQESSEQEFEPDSEEYPGWLTGLVDEGRELDAEFEPVAGGPGEEKPDWLAPFSSVDDLEDDAAGLGMEGEDDLSFAWLDEAAAGEELPASDALDLSGMEPEAGPDDAAVGPFEGEVPDWMEEAGEVEAVRRDADDGLAPAKLPTWLEAMRPVEAAAAVPPMLEDSTRPPENSGPLAGLRGVIPAEPDVARLNASSAYMLKLQIADNQLAYAKAFEAMIASEGVAVPEQKKTGFSSQPILRIAIFLILIAVIGWPLVTGPGLTPLPLEYTGTSDAQRVINALGESPAVMLAVDYQPAVSGEMETAAMAVVEHLMIKGAYLTLVSTHPSGAVQAERLVRRANERNAHLYQSIDEYAVLGYIPGGSAGLAAFSQSARQAVPYAMNSTESGSAWDRAPLQGLSTPADFELLVVVTENAETARDWIEQVGRNLGDTPMVVVASAQAAPMIMPYYQSSPRQVQGMVIGLPGAAAYEKALPRQNPIVDYWDAFSLGITAALVIVFVGGIFNLGKSIIASQRQRGEAA